MSGNNISCVEEKVTISSSDELPFVPEKYPGKVCCLCNLGERSALGQGDLLKLEVPYNGSVQKPEISTPADMDNKDTADRLKKLENNEQNINRRLKGVLKKGVGSSGSDCTYELDKVGHADITDISALQCEGFLYVHRMCGMWTLRRNQITDIAPAQLVLIFSECLTQKCSFCGQFGATLTCKMNCAQVHHWPCAAASGCFLILESFTVFCIEHLSQVPLLCSDNNVECQMCSSLGDLSKLIICCTCGDHFHSTCIGLANFPDTRSGWSCARCSKCQICRHQDSSDIRYVKCEQCQKIYHTTCLRPIISSIPKYGWKCNRCRVCTDCGSRTPGAGTSSRWHCHYTICDSCYQQRNKGFSCPICQKAYRAAAYKEMVKCSWCHKFVHSSCDDEADLATYHKKKELNPDYDYICPHCKFNSQLDQQPNEDSIFSVPQSAEIFCKDSEMESFEKNGTEIVTYDEQLNKLTPSNINNNNKKRMCLTNIRGKVGKFVLQRPGMLPQMHKKRSARGKGRQLILQSSFACGGTERYVNRNIDSDCSSEKKMLLCSARDKFILTQDICVMCGSLGIGSDAAMITCAQCGQCYHPYCVNVKPSKIMMHRGWRCLDCTICEGCGKKNDEARLLLCDECDISYHIYCVDPPLETVPHGNWKCKSCAVCQKCGKNPVGKNAIECYFECGPCSSQSACLICTKNYKDGETIIQCSYCDHWGHFDCDTINKTLNPDYYESHLYKCSQCRFSTKSQKPKMTLLDQALQNHKPSNVNIKTDVERLERPVACEPFENSEVLHWVDGVCVSEHGLNMIKSLTTEIKRKRKLRQIVGNVNKDDGTVLGEDEVQGDAKPLTDIYKDGMIWDNSDNTPPEGFTISTNDEGVNILRKKRQRNLQKLGIGGFSVRNRAMKKETDDGGNMDIPGNLDKKKKVARKKQKNKLSEAYPVYLQEAFFGRHLLDSEEIPSYDSESSDGLDSFSMRIHFNSADQSKIKSDIDKLTAGKVNESQKKSKTENAISDGNEKFSEQFIMDNELKQLQTTQLTYRTPSNLIQNDSFFITDAENGADKRISTDRVVENFTAVPPVKAPSLVPNFNELEKLQIGSSNSNKIDNFSMTSGQVHNSDLSQLQNTFLMKPQVSNPVQQIAIPNAVEVSNLQNKIKLQSPNIHSNETAHSIEPKIVESVVSEGIIGGTQKTAEKMRRDEDLGSMATISAVLYANTKHPDLKELYPNWNDRCKQILKRWRSLSTEKKAPFLQHAKDNRSALRMRRAQQEQQKTNLQQKANKEEELERAWKQHQTKIKESQANVFTNYSAIPNDASFIGCNPKPETKSSVPPYQTDTYLSKTNTQRCLMRTISASPNLKLLSQGSIDFDAESSDVSEKIGDKKLRNLLQKQNSGPPLIGDHVDPFLSNDLYKMTIQANSNIRHNNPMMSNNEKPETSELRQNFHSGLDSDVKSRHDLKLSESTEGVSVATTELEKLETDENGGFGDILGGLGEGDDDDLLKSLTSEIGDDFNILEYADPELDVLASSQSVLNTLDFEDNDKSA